jgi:sugar lactone lactonase YvrE
MNTAGVVAASFAVVVSLGLSAARADPSHLPVPATFTTRTITPFAIEGLTGDAAGNLYTTGRQTDLTKNCPIWRIRSDGARVTVAFIPNPTACNPSGITFDSHGDLYVADSATITGVSGFVWRVTPHPVGCLSDDSASALCAAVPLGTAFAKGVPGTNGLAFDRNGNLWTGDGTTGLGRVWRIAAGGGVCESVTPPSFTGCVEAFRIQAMANALDPAVTGGVANVGRDNRALLPGTINAARAATNALGSQPLVANGVAFTPDGDLYVADTARGAIWKVEFDHHGNMRSPMGCDPTFSANTLCLDAVFTQHPYLEGTDGIVLDRAGNIWSSVNERNAIVVVTRHGAVMEFFRNPVNAVGLRNSATLAANNNRLLEFPTSPFLLGTRLCTSNSDGDRRDNSPRAAGEINAGGPVGARGKISCLDQTLPIPGLPLPVH